MSHRYSARASLFLVSCLLASAALAQEAESEPNNPCQQAQDWGAAGLPFALQGSLDPLSEEVLDIDFYRFSSLPDTRLIIDLEGASTGQGTLADPFLAVLDSSCTPIAFDDDGGAGLNSRLRFAVPVDGEFIVAVTACCDFGLEGAGEGSYLLQLSQLQFIGSVTARLIDSSNGQPIPAGAPYFPSAFLERCDQDGCNSVNFALPDENGILFFSTDFWGMPLEVGNYRINASSPWFEPALTASVAVGEGENADLGDIEMIQIALISSLSGRLVDALNQLPISGHSTPFAFVQLFRCEEFGCFNVRAAIPDSQGFFQYNGADDLTFFRPGTYKLLVRAEQYLDFETSEFEIAQNEDLDLGEIRIYPAPIQVLDIQACQAPSPQGGTCRFGAVVRNSTGQRFDGQAWSLVSTGFLTNRFETSRFQVGRHGAANPAPLNLNIKPGQSETVEFEFYVPAAVLDFAAFCPQILVGESPSSHFNPRSSGFFFCVFKQPSGFSLLSGKESRQIMRERQRN